MDETKEPAIEMEKASGGDAPEVSSVMIDACRRLKERGQALWNEGDLCPEKLLEQIEQGQVYLVKRSGKTIGTVIFQWEDRLYWPDMPEGDAAYLHKLVLTENAAGNGLGKKVMEWARGKAVLAGRKYLRLDCEARRSRLCAYYESAGFILHSFRQVGRQYLARYEMNLGE